MAEPTVGQVRTETGELVDYINAGGEKRLLTWRPTPKGHPTFGALPTWEQHAADEGLPPIRFADLKPWRSVRTDVPILDQNGRGACVTHSAAANVMLARAAAGYTFVDLCPWWLYCQVNRGVDAGSNLGDAVQVLTAKGIPPRGIVPERSVRIDRATDVKAVEQAGRFKVAKVARITGGFEQACVAAFLGYGVSFDLCAGLGFDVNSDGVCRVCLGFNNHEVLAGEEFALIGGKPYIGGRNSWGTQWGVQGRCYWQPAHLDRSQETIAIRFVDPDPQDPDAPGKCPV